jgi:Cu+-exporting ATPase
MKTENSCTHCGSDCGKNPFRLNENIFCCNGCLQVYQLLNEHKLNQYYTLAKVPGIKVESAGYSNKYAFLDKAEVQEKIFEFHENDIAKATFYIPSIHCISCIWLLENLYKLNSGVKHANVNFVQKTYTVSFCPTEISLRQLVELLVSIHYIPDISLQSVENKGKKKVNKSLMYKMGIAGFIAGNVMLFSLPAYFNGKPLEGNLGLFFNYLSYFLTLPLVFYCGNDYLISAWKGLRNKIVNIDLPIALGVLTLFAVTSYEVLTETGQGYSDSLAGLLFFLLVGRWYQSKTYEALAFDRDYKSYFPVAVTRITEKGEESTLLKDVNVGDTLLIRSKELIPADSVLVNGTALIDYSFVTGESRLIRKETGEFLYAGGIQSTGAITIRITKEISQSHLTKLWNQSEDKRPATNFLMPIIDKISFYFTLTIILLALLGLFVWWYKGYFSTGILVFTAVLIITCPCALALSLPFTFGNAMRMLGNAGIYIKNTHVIEKLTRIDTLVFDKTGTITVPDESKVQYNGEELTSEEIQAIASLAKQSTHPLSSVVAKYYNKLETLEVAGYVEVSGRGVFGIINQLEIKLGSPEYITKKTVTNSENASVVYVAINGKFKGYYLISNMYREGFDKVISDLKTHFKLYLLSGDNDSERDTLQQYFDPECMYFDQKPQDKKQFIEQLQKNGHNVLMTGDGLNDAGAFMQSNVAISVADNIYHFSPAGDAIIDATSFHKLFDVIKYTKRALTIVKISFAISFLYNAIGLIYALSGTLSPVIGAILMPISSVTVVAFATLATRLAAGRILRKI